MPNRRLAALSSAAIALLVLAGCAKLSKSYPEQRRYKLTLPAPAKAAKAPSGDAVLKVTPFSASDAFQKVEFAYRTAENTWESDFYNVFVVPPASQIADEVRAFVAASSPFRHVVGPGSSVEATHLLEGHLRTIYVDFRDRKAPKAIVSLEFTLLDVRAGPPRVALHRAYQAEAPVDTKRAQKTEQGEAIVAAWNRALEQIMREFDGHLAAVPLAQPRAN